MFNNNDIMANADKIRQEIRDLKLNNAEYRENTYVATGSKSRVIGRIMNIYELLAKIIGKKGDFDVKRTYSAVDKEHLWHEGYICSWCGNQILDINDAEVDHIVAFNNGGQTVLGNAQLLLNIKLYAAISSEDIR